MKKIDKRYSIVIALLLVVALLLAGVLGVSLYRHQKIVPKGKPDNSEYCLVTDTAYDNQFDTVKVSSNCGNIFILPSDDTQLYLKIWADEDKVRIHETGAFLDITADARDDHQLGIHNANLQQVRIELYLPDDFNKTLQMKTNYGNFEVESFPQMQLIAESDYGNLTLDEVRSLEADFEYGSLKAGTIHAFVKAESDMGNIDIDTLSITEDSQMACDMGSIHIDSAPTAVVEASANLGSVNVRPNPDGATVKLTLENDNGSITVKS